VAGNDEGSIINLQAGYGHILTDKPLGTIDQLDDHVGDIEEFLNKKLDGIV